MRSLRYALLTLLLAALAAGLPGCGERRAAGDGGPIPIGEVLRGDSAADFAQVDGPRDFNFPGDHGPHHDYRTEWWYFTGNLEAAQGDRFGYQLTFFRFRPRAGAAGGSSNWRSDHFYMAHFALTDIGAATLHGFERFSRGAAGLAGATAGSLHVWLDDWSARGEGQQTFPLRLRAREGAIALDLEIAQDKPVVLHGDKGISVKNSEPGNASYYYSYTRMPTRGEVTVNGRSLAVDGLSWMDREWSSSALGREQIGWDWFALQLSHGEELMYYRFRRSDGSADRFSYGALVGADGNVQTLAHDELQLAVLDTWTSPATGVTYPAGWDLRVPGQQLHLRVAPAVANQELDLSFRYWEGAVEVSGSHGEDRVSGRGYVELTGYR